MARKTVDCRTIPNEVGCTLAISGEEDELLEAAVIHAVTRHHDRDSDELRNGIRASMVDEVAPA
jgi:predicted small metal-binding protein